MSDTNVSATTFKENLQADRLDFGWPGQSSLAKEGTHFWSPRGLVAAGG